MEEDILDVLFGPEPDEKIPPMPNGRLDDNYQWQLVTDPSTQNLEWVPLPTDSPGINKTQSPPDSIEIVSGMYTSAQMLQLSQLEKPDGTWVGWPDKDGVILWHLESPRRDR